MTWKSTAVASGVTVAGMWVASYAPVGRPASTPDAPTPATTAAASAEIQREARRLRERLEHVAGYREPSRNPFSFVTPRRAPARPQVPSVADEAAPVSVPEPPAFRLSLAGIAEDTVDGALVRTAVIATPDTVLLVKVGDRVDDLYRVTAVHATAVELARLDDATTMRLALSP